MMSISKFMKAAQVKTYHKKDSYYQKNNEAGKWAGDEEALGRLGIKNGEEIEEKKWEKLLNGFDPESGEKLVKSAGEENHRAAMDLTFSAPKSVSIQMEILEANGFEKEGKEIRDAHERAVKKTLKNIQENYIFTRQKQGNQIARKHSKGAIFVQFQHDTSRLLDPQLHTHNVLFNLVYDEKNNKFNTLSNEEIFKNKMYFGQEYRAELAKNIQSLGYEIEIDHAKGNFEIKAIDEQIRDEFSKMSNEMKAAKELRRELEAKYPNAGREKIEEILLSELRPAKKRSDRDAVREDNRERAADLGYTKERIKEILLSRREQGSIDKKEVEKIAREAVDRAAKSITKSKSVFSREELITEAMKHGIGKVTAEDIEKEIFNSKEEIRILNKNAFSTQAQIDLERDIIKKAHNQKQLQPLINKEQLEDQLEKYPNMTNGQKRMLEAVIATGDQYVAIEGDAGTGKTYAMKAIKEIGDEKGKEIIGISFTGKAAEGMEAESGIKSQTVHSYLHSGESQGKDRIIIVDEAGMLSAMDMKAIMDKAEEKNNKVIFVGDTKQFDSIAAGKAFRDIQEHGGIKTVEMTEVMRQKTEESREFVKAVKEEDIENAFSILEQNEDLVEGDREKLIEAIASESAKTKTDDLLVIASTNFDKNELNGAIREKMNLPGGEDHEVMIPKNPNGIAAEYAKGYLSESGEKRVGVLHANIDGFRRGEKIEIVGEGKSVDELLVKRSNGEIKSINLARDSDKLSVFSQEKREFSAGDKIIFTKNIQDKKNGFRVKNGETAAIKSIEGGKIEAINSSGKVKNFNINEMPYVDHGYAVTDYKSQGMTSKKVLALANTRSPTFGKKAFYVQATRASHKMKIFTEDISALKVAAKRQAERLSTLDFGIKIKIKEKKYDRNGKTNERYMGPLERGQRSAGSDRKTANLYQRISGKIARLHRKGREKMKSFGRKLGGHPANQKSQTRTKGFEISI